MKESIRVRISDRTSKALSLFAKAQGKTKSSIVRYALNQFLSKVGAYTLCD